MPNTRARSVSEIACPTELGSCADCREGVDDKVIAELIKLERKRSVFEKNLTPRERMRALRRRESVEKPLSIEPVAGDVVAKWLRSMSRMSGIAFGDAIATRHQLAAVIHEVDFDRFDDSDESQPRMARAYRTNPLKRLEY